MLSRLRSPVPQHLHDSRSSSSSVSDHRCPPHGHAVSLVNHCHFVDGPHSLRKTGSVGVKGDAIRSMQTGSAAKASALFHVEGSFVSVAARFNSQSTQLFTTVNSLAACRHRKTRHSHTSCETRGTSTHTTVKVWAGRRIFCVDFIRRGPWRGV